MTDNYKERYECLIMLLETMLKNLGNLDDKCEQLEKTLNCIILNFEEMKNNQIKEKLNKW